LQTCPLPLHLHVHTACRRPSHNMAFRVALASALVKGPPRSGRRCFAGSHGLCSTVPVEHPVPSSSDTNMSLTILFRTGLHRCLCFFKNIPTYQLFVDGFSCRRL
jgi:hypothetical protein